MPFAWDKLALSLPPLAVAPLDYLAKLLPLLWNGLCTTLSIFFLTLLFAWPLGLLVSFGRMSKIGVVRWPIKIYISIMRGTPLMLQIMFFYFGPYYIFGASYDRFIAVIVAFSLNYAAYFAEIYRGGIESIPLGQYEAAQVLGFSRVQTFFRVVFPQMVKRILPAMGNEVITLVKDTSLAQIIAVVELFRVAQTAAAKQSSIIPLFMAGVFYYIMNYLVAFVFEKMEKRLAVYR